MVIIRLPEWGDQNDFDLYWEEIQLHGDAILANPDKNTGLLIARAAEQSAYNRLPLGVHALLYSAASGSLRLHKNGKLKEIGPTTLSALIAHDIALHIALSKARASQRTSQPDHE